MKIALAQLNPVIADIEGNRNRIIQAIRDAKEQGADLVVCPEMATLGYPPMDLLENPKLIRDNLVSLELIMRETSDIGVVCGYVDLKPGRKPDLYNSAAFMYKGGLMGKQHKTLLPSYDVFDEGRYFSSAAEQQVMDFDGTKIGITICEDIWTLAQGAYMEQRTYSFDPVACLAEMGAELIVNISASPFVKGKSSMRYRLLSETASRYAVDIVYVNQTGGNDGLIFDGNSMLISSGGELLFQSPCFEESVLICDTEKSPVKYDEMDEIEEVRKALVTGLRDYVKKCGFKSVVVGLSGGIDSAVTAALAVQALGGENVLGVTMPSMYSSEGSINDSKKLAENLGMEFKEIPIRGIYDQFMGDLKPLFGSLERDLTEENLQARIRGNLLMALSNKFKSLLLTTGNKSELAMGYCTLYGDMCGGLGVIADCPKTLVYRLARHINREKEIIPWDSISKAPSAELRENQTDQDTLPPYDILDEILELYIEERKSADEIVRQGFDESIVSHVLRTVNISEYKRRQSATGLKITSKAFGTGRRIPIAQAFRP